MWRQYRVYGREVDYLPGQPPTVVLITRVIIAESDEDAEAMATLTALEAAPRDVISETAVAV